MISAIRTVVMRMAVPALRRAPASRIPFPAQAISQLKLPDRTWGSKPSLAGAAAVAVTVGAMGYLMTQKPVNHELEAGLEQLASLSRGLSDIDTLDAYMELAFELQYKGGDRKYLEEVWVNVEKAFVDACEKGDINKIGRITSYIEVRKIKLPEVSFSRIPGNCLLQIVDRLLDTKNKKLSVEDFEWALLHKNYELYEVLLRYLDSDKTVENVATWELRKYEHSFDTGMYASYEYLLEHPRIRPYQETARAYHERHEARLRERCQNEILEIQQLMNGALRTQLTVEELCQKKFREEENFESILRGTILFVDARDKMIFLKKLLDTNDTSTLHWLSVQRDFWKPRASGVAGWC